MKKSYLRILHNTITDLWKINSLHYWKYLYGVREKGDTERICFISDSEISEQNLFMWLIRVTSVFLIKYIAASLHWI